MSRTRAFFCGFCLTAAVLVPLIGCILLLRETTVPSALLVLSTDMGQEF